MKDEQPYWGQWEFQKAHAIGKILNVGCNTDGAEFALHGGINIDLALKDGHTGNDIPAHVLADGRSLPFCGGSFDSVILGEILEHMQPPDAVLTIVEAGKVLKPGGRVVITIPHDDRPMEEQGVGTGEYFPGIAAYHYREITREELFDWIKEAGMKVTRWGEITYIWGKRGTGVVATWF